MSMPSPLIKEKPPAFAEVERLEYRKGVCAITRNQLKAQAQKGKKRATHFTTLVAKALKAAVDQGYPIKIELGTPAPVATITPLEEWKRSREG